MYWSGMPIVPEMPLFATIGPGETWTFNLRGVGTPIEFLYAFAGGPSCPPKIGSQQVVVSPQVTTETVAAQPAPFVLERDAVADRAVRTAMVYAFDREQILALAENPPSLQRAQAEPSGQMEGGTTDGNVLVVPGSAGPREFGGMAFVFLRASRTTWQSARTKPPLTVYLTSLGTSTGEAFTLTALNHGRDPVSINVDDLVLEPVTGVTGQQIAREIASHRGGRVTTTLTAYCLEFLKTPPAAGAVFRLADRRLADKHSRLRHIVAATRRMQHYGLLPPDGGDARAYFHSIRQWAIWTQEQLFDERRFADAFVQHTRKNAEQAGRQWTDAFDKAARSLVPGRWRAVQFALNEAGRFERAEATGGRGQ